MLTDDMIALQFTVSEYGQLCITNFIFTSKRNLNHDDVTSVPNKTSYIVVSHILPLSKLVHIVFLMIFSLIVQLHSSSKSLNCNYNLLKRNPKRKSYKRCQQFSENGIAPGFL